MKTSSKQSEEDAFLYYSNDEIRLKTLKLEEGSSSAVDTRTTSKASSSSRQYERKTRISFEVDPLLVLGDDLDELFNDDDEDDFFGDIDFSHLKNDHNDSKVDLLTELLRM